MNSRQLTRGLVQQLTQRLFLTVGLMLGAIAIGLFSNTIMVNNQKSMGELRETVSLDVSGLVSSMVDQETGVRGYVNAADPLFLEPYTKGRPQYLDFDQHLKNLTQTKNLEETSAALLSVERRATEWYEGFAQLQVKRVETGQVAQARNEANNGKELFDRFRAAADQLKRAAEADLNRLQKQADQFFWFTLIGVLLVSLIAVVFIWIGLNTFVNKLKLQLIELMDVTDRLEQGDLTARVLNPKEDELGRLAQNFNNMAEALDEQQTVLRQRDILESVTQLTEVLTTTLNLEALANQFLSRLSKSLDLQVTALYIKDPAAEELNLLVVQGLSRRQMQTTCQPGEGLLGQVLVEKETIYLSRPTHEEAREFEIQTGLGNILPGTLGYIPLRQNDELLGVVVVASVYPVTEKTRNILNVVTPNLAAAIANARSYTYIQAQTAELERGQLLLETTNFELSQQRDKLQTLNVALERANQVRAEFFSTMSHELRTPLTAIIGFSQLSLSSAEASRLSDRQRNNLERIFRNGQHLLTMINNVLDLAKIEAGRMDLSLTEFEMSSFLPPILDEMQSLATQKKLTLTYSIEKELGAIQTDSMKLRQILVNLISNAIKFTDKGEVSVMVRKMSAAPGEDIGRVAIAVQDTGIGIDPEEQRRIFDDFYQVTNSGISKAGGTGLGLSIVQRLVNLLDGKLEVQSQPGHGSTFIIILPLKLQARTSQTAFEPARLYSPSLPPVVTHKKLEGIDSVSKKVVLAVDDDADALSLIQSLLEDSPYQVLGLKDPSRLAELMIQVQPFAITLDVLMPSINGWQILHELKSNPATASIPVIILSIVSDHSAGFILGANDYLVKPIDRGLLLQALERLTSKADSRLLEVGAGSKQRGFLSAPTVDLGESESDRPYILVVDDEKDIREMLEQTISEAGMTVRTAVGGLDALKQIAENPPGIILLDLMMPDVSGFEVLERLKANPASAAIPVIILTAKSLTDLEHEQLQTMSRQVLQKGNLRLTSFMEEIKQMLEN